jgi:hypothetical protein
MAFLNDLNAGTWLATFLTVVICGCVLFLDVRDWMNHWKFHGYSQCAFLWILSLGFLAGAIYAYSPDADVPRKTAAGDYRAVSSTGGRGTRVEYICVNNCAETGGHVLALQTEALEIVANGPAGRRYEFEYLTRPSGNVVLGVWLRVVGIRDADSGAQLFEIDLARHLGRMTVLIFDAVLFIVTGFICLQLHRKKKSADSEDAEPAESKPEAEEMTSLNLS